MARTEPGDKRRLMRVIAVLIGLCLSLAAICAFLLFRSSRPEPDLARIARLDPEIREQAVQRLVANTKAVWDSFPDPDVGRVLLASLENQSLGGQPLSSNSYGVREREWAVPKPAGVLRIVILGDSFVMGMGLGTVDRVGSFLESYLTDRARGSDEGEIECLQIGQASWNVVAECAFLRRQLSLLEPDLVVQVLIQNDLDDTASVRGLGVLANFTSQRRWQANAMVSAASARHLGFRSDNWLTAGLDHESRSRYGEAEQAVLGLRRALGVRGAKYLLLMRWGERQPIAERFLGGGLTPEEKAYLPIAFNRDPRYRLAPTNDHWNRAGNEEVARLLYALIVERELLPSLDLEPWDEAAASAAALQEAGRREATEPFDLEGRLAERPIASRIDFDALDKASAAQLHGGIDPRGSVAPYGSTILRRGAGDVLELVGSCPPRSELLDPTVEVYVDEHPAGTLRLEPGHPFQVRMPLPAAVRDRRFVSVRFVASDYAYTGPGLRACTAFRLQRVALITDGSAESPK